MLKKSFLAVLVASLALACAPSKTVVVTDPPKKEQPKPTPAPAAKVTWSITIPEGWEKVVKPDPVAQGDVVQAVAARKEYTHESKSYMAVLEVKVGRIPPELVESFPEGMLEMETSKRNVRILDARPLRFGTVDGVEWAEVRQVDGLMVVAGAAVAKGDLGIRALCGTDVNGAEAIMDECASILESISVK